MAHRHQRCAEHLARIKSFKTFFNLADEIPNDFLSEHLIAACLKLQEDTGLSAPPDNRETEWQHAQHYLALAYALPHLNTFTLQGAACVERLATQMDARFMDAEEVQKRIGLLTTHYEALVDNLLNFSSSATTSAGDQSIVTNNELAWIAI